MILGDSVQLGRIIEDLAAVISNDVEDDSKTVLIGIQTRGVFIAERIRAMIKAGRGYELPVGKIDVTMFRDDINYRSTLPKIRETSIGFDIDGKKIILIDDVLYTGRTVKAAIEDITSFGRPDCIRLAVVVDRGLRELPVQPDFCGMKVETVKTDSVRVRMTEADGEDLIVLNA